jgi:hypothetical protein
MGKHKRRNFKRDRRCLSAYLEGLCQVCSDRIPLEKSILLPCCGKCTHKSCLAKWFYHEPTRQGCPFCRKVLVPLNANDLAPPKGGGVILIRFSQVVFEHGLDDSTSSHNHLYHDWVGPSLDPIIEGPLHFLTSNLRLVRPRPRAMGFDDSPQIFAIPPHPQLEPSDVNCPF